MNTTITKEAKGYIFNQETKQLESYELISIRFKFTEGNKTYKCLVAGIEKEIVTPFLKVYKTKEDFERENYSNPFIVGFNVVNENGYSICREDSNGDYYSFMVHMCQKDRYDMKTVLEKPDTFIEENIKAYIEEHDKLGDFIFSLVRKGNDETLSFKEYGEMSDVIFVAGGEDDE